MNKKVSTIFAMAALMGGVFSGSAYAQTTHIDLSDVNTVSQEETIANGTQVLLGQGGYYLGLNVSSTGTKSLVGQNAQISVDDKNYYLWTVGVIGKTSPTGHTQYTFTNVATGDTLSFNVGDGAFRYTQGSGASKMWAADPNNGAFAFNFENADYDDGNQQLKTESAIRDLGGNQGVLNISASGANLNGTANTGLFTLADVNVPANTLNTWYNGKGFNLESNPANAEGNLFEGDTRIWAFDVEIDNNNDGTEAETEGYTFTASDGIELTIPNGTYFFTDAKFLNGYNEISIKGITDPAQRAAQIDWLNSTFIAVSSTETSESTDTDRANGEGFRLVTAKGSDFILLSNVSEFAGNDLAIWNACFVVEDNYNASAPYSIRLKHFYYKANVSAANTVAQATQGDVFIGVSSYNGTEYRVVSMRDTAPIHTFGFSDSAVKDGRELLNETPTAAIYNIKFVSGNSNLNDKYLTTGLNATGTAYRYEAKGEAVVEKSYPAFQWLITRATAPAGEDKYTEVTFTNRETGEQFKTKLFNESGENCYSLDLSNLTITPFTVNTQSANTYVVEQLNNVTYNSNIIIQLEKVETVDQYAGFLKVDNKTIRTLAFARDKNDTSNKLFAVVESRDDATYNYLGEDFYYKLNEDDKFATEISEAAQWQLVRGGAVTTTRTFVYNNTTTESVDDVANGDKVSAYTYALRYVVDGTEEPYFLMNSTTSSELQLKDLTETQIDNLESKLNATTRSDYNSVYAPIAFIIKENVDGSVSLLKRLDKASTTAGGSSYNPFIDADANKVVEVSYNTRLEEYQYDFNSEEAYSTLEGESSAVGAETLALEIRTYLDPQPIEISWPAHEGHVTLKSELGNYITMNEDRDGIIVNENDADTYYLYVTDEKAVVPSFYITKGVAAENGERMYLFNPTDSAAYYVTPEGKYSRIYQWNEDHTKVMFKSGVINETRDTLTLTVKGEADKKVAMEADDNDKNIWGGLNRFKWQIIEAGDEAEGYYYIRQPKADNNSDNESINTGEVYLANWNDKLTWSDKTNALLFEIESVAAPTANEGVSATEVKIIATDGAVNVKNAAGKNVVISTILGQIVANEVLTSDNATISVPAGIAIVSVDGEEAVKVSVR